tara:strand:+ start:1060 stop:1995 length:936 start_codon:yes stop_codon:yes gene_type:complete
MKNTKIVELVIEENNEALAIDAISLVSAPAIEQDFVYFGKEKHNLTFAKVDEEKRMLVSPALIPNKQIFRYDPNTDSEYYVYFSPDTVRKASELYLKHNNHHKATYEHQDRVSGVLTTESWIIEDPKNDKSTLYGYDLPKGTWMVKMRIDNDDLWQKIKAGELKGLSIEGYFVDKMQNMSKEEFTIEEIRTALKEIISPKLSKAKEIELKARAKIDSYAQDAEKLYWNIKERAEKELSGTFQMIEKDSKKVKKILEEVQDDYSDFLKSLKAIGIKPSEIKQPRQFELAIKETSDWYEKLEKLSTKIKKINI